jgi:phosphatidylserine/phosphatidylglycerophosphate/cardiolipin synthase-like enzyme
LYRECEADLPEDLETPPPDSKAALLRESKRFMIYVHSKLMIVDDSVAIVGKMFVLDKNFKKKPCFC